MVKQSEIINAFDKIGAIFKSLGKDEIWPGFHIGLTEDEYIKTNNLILAQRAHNGWFTEDAVRTSLLGISQWLHIEAMNDFANNYNFTAEPKKVLIIMAGNIPLVGFHDFLCVLLSGNTALCKLSSDDKFLLPHFANILCTFLPELKERIVFDAQFKNMEAVIATGSDNSALYFNQYFGKYPHIFRKNRTSVAILTGDESDEELEALGEDIFTYFGLGCRNVTYLLMAEKFPIDRLFLNIVKYGDVINHHKYANNYDYNRVVYLMNKENLLDNNVVLLRESDILFSPLAMLHYSRYKNQEELDLFLEKNKDDIQVVVGRNFLPFGEAQKPQINDFADGVDTMAFLSELKS